VSNERAFFDSHFEDADAMRQENRGIFVSILILAAPLGLQL
jgi:hypothetical protein